MNTTGTARDSSAPHADHAPPRVEAGLDPRRFHLAVAVALFVVLVLTLVSASCVQQMAADVPLRAASTSR